MDARQPCEYESILHPTDFSRGSDVAFAHALKLTLAARAMLNILHVDANPREVRWNEFPHVRKTLIRWGILPAGASKADVARTKCDIRKSKAVGTDAAEGVLAHLDQYPADLIVLATHQREGLARWLHKEIAGRIAANSDADTLFLPHGRAGFVRLKDGSCSLQNVLIPICRQPAPQLAIDAAAKLAQATAASQVTFTLLHVGEADDTPAVTKHRKGEWSWGHLTRHGAVVDQILQVSKLVKADLIVMATEGRHGFLDALRGSTTEAVLQHCGCPVLAVHAS